MYEVFFYRDKNGKSEVEEYLQELNKKDNKESKIKFNKIIAYINMLEQYGISIGEPYIKHIQNNIWELRPIRDRIFFAHWDNNKFIILNVFMKKTQKTPDKEIEKAKRYLKDFIDRSDKHGR